MAVVHGGMSTFLAVVLLSLSASYVFRVRETGQRKTYFKRSGSQNRAGWKAAARDGLGDRLYVRPPLLRYAVLTAYCKEEIGFLDRSGLLDAL